MYKGTKLHGYKMVPGLNLCPLSRENPNNLFFFFFFNLLNEHTGQQWLSHITENADAEPNKGWCNTMRLWVEACY